MCVLQYDPESSGFISTERFKDLLDAHGSELDPHKLEVLLALADGNADGKICYQDFVNLVGHTGHFLSVGVGLMSSMCCDSSRLWTMLSDWLIYV